ncbi:MAG: T9SS type A sorting domain-containing protein [Bacteroidetes bacterium]|nr:T9SS type A sorting domain-containing protein [Bacteroidota bacterium]
MKTKNFLVLLLAILLFENVSTAQIKFRKVIGSSGYDYGVCAQQTLDSGYIVLGSTSSFGGGNTDIYLVKTDSLGIPQGHQMIGGINIDRGTCVKQTTDKGFIISGYTNSFGAGGYDFYLIKVDSTYNVTWTKTYGGTNWDFANCVEQTNDGGYIVCGETYSYGNGDEDYYIVKTNSLGDTVWTKTYGGLYQDVAKSIIQTSDGNYLVTGTSKSLGDIDGDFFTIKLNTSGDSLWSNRFGGASADFGNDVIESMFGGYLLTGETKSFGAGNAYGVLVKISSLGITDSMKTLGGTLDDSFYSVVEDADGKVAMLGTSKSFGDSGGNGDLIFYTLKSDWSYYGLTTFGGLKKDEGFSVAPTFDNAFIICGTTKSFSTTSIEDIYLIKTDTLCLATIAENTILTEIEDVDNSLNGKLNVFPNPANQTATIDVSFFEDSFTIEVTNVMGETIHLECVKKGSETTYSLPLDLYSNGIYLLKVSDKSRVETQKIIIVH